MLGRCKRMLTKTKESDQFGTPGATNGRRFLTLAIVSMIPAGLMAPILFSLVADGSLEADAVPAILFACTFGGWVGLVPGVVFAGSKTVRDYVKNSLPKTILVFGAVGAIAGAPPFFIFGDGLAFALALGLQGAVFGGVLAAVSGLIVGIVLVRSRSRS
jgi:hypothetical protein